MILQNQCHKEKNIQFVVVIKLGGEYMCHNIQCKSRKEAEEKARHFQNANGVIEHSGHFHAARNGVKISGYHFNY